MHLRTLFRYAKAKLAVRLVTTSEYPVLYVLALLETDLVYSVVFLGSSGPTFVTTAHSFLHPKSYRGCS